MKASPFQAPFWLYKRSPNDIVSLGGLGAEQAWRQPQHATCHLQPPTHHGARTHDFFLGLSCPPGEEDLFLLCPPGGGGNFNSYASSLLCPPTPPQANAICGFGRETYFCCPSAGAHAYSWGGCLSIGNGGVPFIVTPLPEFRFSRELQRENMHLIPI